MSVSCSVVASSHRIPLVAGLAVGLTASAAVIGVTLNARQTPASMLQIIPVMNGQLAHYNTFVPYDEPENVGMYEYQAHMEPMSQMGTNTAFLGSHDGLSLDSLSPSHPIPLHTAPRCPTLGLARALLVPLLLPAPFPFR